jgi:hypothetical protein
VQHTSVIRNGQFLGVSPRANGRQVSSGSLMQLLGEAKLQMFYNDGKARAQPPPLWPAAALPARALFLIPSSRLHAVECWLPAIENEKLHGHAELQQTAWHGLFRA